MGEIYQLLKCGEMCQEFADKLKEFSIPAVQSSVSIMIEIYCASKKL